MPQPILLVEDDRIYAMLAKGALKRLLVPNELVHVSNGRQALDYLYDKQKAKPCVILLDLHMPVMNGIEFLRIVESNKSLRSIPVSMVFPSPTSSAISRLRSCLSTRS